MAKVIVGIVVVIILGVVGFYVWQGMGGTAAPTPTPTPAPVDTRSTYASSTLGFSIKYPQDFTVNEKYAYQGVPKKPIAGVKFTIPMTMATGTNLSADSGVSVEWLPNAKSCTGDIYIFDNVKAQELTEGGVEYSVATTSGAGAGNLYEETVYAIASSSPCTAVRYLIHSTQLANYPAGTVRAFDRAALLAAFDKVRQSLVLQ